MMRPEVQQPLLQPGVRLELPPVSDARCGPPRRGKADETDYAQRAFLNLLATIALLVIATGMVWTVLALDAQEKLRRCLDTGQRECVQLVPPQPGVWLVPNH